MIGFYVNGEFLDLYPGNRVEFVKNNEIYATGDPEFIQGSYSFPIRVPLTPLNNKLLKYPGVLAASDPPRVLEDVTFYAGEGKSIGLPIFSGRLYAKKAGPVSAEIFMVVEGLSIKKDIKLNEIDLGEYATISSAGFRTAAKDTLFNPLNYNHCFFSVLNLDYTDKASLTEPIYGGDITNFYDPDISHFMPSAPDYTVLIPFVRVDYILSKIIESFGYSIDNQFQVEDEMKLLYIYNNYNVHQYAYPNRIHYNNHVPIKNNAVDFVKAICRTFFVGIFVDTTNKKISLIPLKNLLNQPHRHDWSSKASYDYENEQDNSIPKSFGYDIDSGDSLFGENVEKDLTVYGSFSNYYGLTAPADGNWFYQADGSYRIVSGGGSKIVAKFWQKYNTAGRGEEYKSQAIPVFTGDDLRFAQVGIKGTTTIKVENPETAAIELRRDVNELSAIRLLFYRGVITTFPSPLTTVPYASSLDFIPGVSAGPPSNEAYQFALTWDGANGIYEKWAKEWIYFMEKKKIVKRSFLLKLSDIINLKEYDKVWVSGQAYFIKSMRISFTDTGIDPVECEMYSIPQS